MKVIAKQKDKIEVKCVGMSAAQVTGSMYLVECPTGEKILLDCGLYQGGNCSPFESYKINSKKFSFKPSELTFVALSHLNIDHIGLIPKLVNDGANCHIYMSEENIEFLRPMFEDSAKIMERDVLNFCRRYKKNYMNIYTQEDVEYALPYFRGCEKNKVIQITDNVGIEFISAGHIFGSCQIKLYIKLLNGQIRTITYSGDLGNTLFEQPFVDDFKPIEKNNMFIGECTYNDPLRSAKKSYREKDLEKIKSVIQQTCIENKGTVLIPTFALQRTEVMLYTLWQLFKDDKDFNIPVVIDSPLAVKLLDCFRENLKGKDKDIFEKMLSWKNIKIIRTIEESQDCVADEKPKIICSSSGMLTNGRSILYLKKILPRRNCSIILCGYMAEGSLGWKIKNFPERKTITIDKKAYQNRCNIYSLKTYSSHMQYEELLKYYTNIAKNGCEIIWLVHGDSGKIEFKKELENRIAKINRTTKVVATNYETKARL